MPRLRTVSSVRTPPGSELERAKPKPHGFQKGRRKTGGRARGTGNFFSLGIRESILTALTNCGGERGLTGFIEAAVKEDTGYGIKLLCAIVPRQADITVTRNEPAFNTVAELDAYLAANNLPPTCEIFAVDFRGTPIPPDAEEAEILEPEPSPPVSR
jgi:hypothetical protein